MAIMAQLSPPIEQAPTLLSAPIELAGDWGHMLPRAADQVVERMRHACLDGVRLLSDRQPTRLRVDEHTSGSPAVWLHPDGSSMAWVIVDIGERDWSKLAYQFGHELGHVMANSWQPHAKPMPPCQWIEEALVEAFSIRGLGRLAESWKQNPPFAGDNAFGDAIADYRENIIQRYTPSSPTSRGSPATPPHGLPITAARSNWPGLNPFAQAASPHRPRRIRARTLLRRGAGRAEPLAGPHRCPYRRLLPPVAGELRRAAGLAPIADSPTGSARHCLNAVRFSAAA